MRDHVELQSRLLQCAGGGSATCERVSGVVVQAIRPADSGRRTDVTLFGLCTFHAPKAGAIVTALGYQEGVVVEWSALGELLTEMERAGLLVA